MAGGVHDLQCIFQMFAFAQWQGIYSYVRLQEGKQVCKTNRVFLLILVTEFENWLNLSYTPLSHQVLQTEEKMVLGLRHGRELIPTYDTVFVNKAFNFSAPFYKM